MYPKTFSAKAREVEALVCWPSRSAEAKALGIKMGDPEFKLRELIKRENIRVSAATMPCMAISAAGSVTRSARWFQRLKRTRSTRVF